MKLRNGRMKNREAIVSANIDKKRRKVQIIPGDELIGMGLLEKIGSKLIVDFDRAEVKLMGH
jgi:hypothetical protein